MVNTGKTANTQMKRAVQASSGARKRGLAQARVGAMLATGSAVLHAVTLTHASHPLLAVGMVAMIVACLSCAYDLWTTDSLRAWVLVGLMNLVMIGVHLPMTAGHRHHGSVPAVVEPVSGAPVMAVATGVAVLEVALAAAVLLYRTRHYADALHSRRISE